MQKKSFLFTQHPYLTEKTHIIHLFIVAMMVQGKPKLQVALKYAMVECTPPKISDIPAIRHGKSMQFEFIFRTFDLSEPTSNLRFDENEHRNNH